MRKITAFCAVLALLMVTAFTTPVYVSDQGSPGDETVYAADQAPVVAGITQDFSDFSDFSYETVASTGNDFSESVSETTEINGLTANTSRPPVVGLILICCGDVALVLKPSNQHSHSVHI